MMPDPLAGLPPRFLRTPEAARFLGLSGRTLEKHRTYGTGPTYRKIGGRVIYALTITIDRTKIRRARETRCVENRQLSSPTIPPPAPPPCAGTSGDRPHLQADDWTAPSIAEPVAAVAIGSVVGSFAGAGAAMRSDSIVRQEEDKS
jgi:hypothetical protein